MLQPTEVLFVKYLVTISGRAVVALRVEDLPETSYTGITIMKFSNVLLNEGDGYWCVYRASCRAISLNGTIVC